MPALQRNGLCAQDVACMSGSARKIKSKARHKNMRAWKRKKMFELMARYGTPSGMVGGDMIFIDEAAYITDEMWARFLHQVPLGGIRFGV